MGRTIASRIVFAWFASTALVIIAHGVDNPKVGPAMLGVSAGVQEPSFPSRKEIAAAERAYTALLQRLSRIKTLSMQVIHGNFRDGGSRTVHFPPSRKPRADDPKTIEDCFNLSGVAYHLMIRTKFRGEKVALLQHIPGDGADGYGVLYISEKTGWPVATGYAPDRSEPHLTEFKKLRITLKRAK